VIISDSFVVADWNDPGTDPGRPIAGLHDFERIFEEHDSELLA
jgi:hypothetical protein